MTFKVLFAYLLQLIAITKTFFVTPILASTNQHDQTQFSKKLNIKLGAVDTYLEVMCSMVDFRAVCACCACCGPSVVPRVSVLHICKEYSYSYSGTGTYLGLFWSCMHLAETLCTQYMHICQHE